MPGYPKLASGFLFTWLIGDQFILHLEVISIISLVKFKVIDIPSSEQHQIKNSRKWPRKDNALSIGEEKGGRKKSMHPHVKRSWCKRKALLLMWGILHYPVSFKKPSQWLLKDKGNRWRSPITRKRFSLYITTYSIYSILIANLLSKR